MSLKNLLFIRSRAPMKFQFGERVHSNVDRGSIEILREADGVQANRQPTSPIVQTAGEDSAFLSDGILLQKDAVDSSLVRLG